MNPLTLAPGPRLLKRREPSCSLQDVSERAHEYLFSDVELDPLFTLADLFALLQGNAVLQTVYRRDFAAELCAETQKGPVAPKQAPWEVLESLELYQQWRQDSSTQEMFGMDHWHMHGIGVVQLEDRLLHGHVEHAKGTQICWGVSLTPVRELLHIPLRVSSQIPIIEEDVDSTGYMGQVGAAVRTGITLGALIHAVLGELSWYGTPQESAAVLSGLRAQMTELEEGTLETVAAEDVFESLGLLPTEVVYAQFFDGLGAVPLAEVHAALRAVGDTDLAEPALEQRLDGRLTLKPGFEELRGRELRKAVRLAKHAHAEDSGIFGAAPKRKTAAA